MARQREQIQTDGAPKTDKRRRQRVTIYLNDDGTPDLDGVTDEQREAIGLRTATAEPEAPPMEVAPEMVSMLLATMIRIESAVIAPRIGITTDEAMAALTPAPPIAEGISTAGARVLQKYGGALGKWQDEIVLATLIVTWQAQAFAEMRSIRAANTPPPQQTPAPPDVHVSSETPVAGNPKKVNFGEVMKARRAAAATAAAVPVETNPFTVEPEA